METVLSSMDFFHFFQRDVQMEGVERFTLKDIRRMTNNFSVEVVGKGYFGMVYKAALPSGRTVAIKRLKKTSNQVKLQTWKAEIQLLSRIHHRNLVRLIGFCIERKEEILVYEYISNGTLQEKLEGGRLGWMERLSIALDCARGLRYLHNYAEPPIIHRDIKPGNILLDDTLTAKIADFGISKTVPVPGMSYIQETQVIGTEIYLDPEYGRTRKLNKRSDVYSFGVVMLQLIGLQISSPYMVHEFRTKWREADRSDRRLRDVMNIPLLETNGGELTGFDSFVNLAFYCVKECLLERPRIEEVVSRLEGIKNEAAGGNSAPSSSSKSYPGISNPTDPYYTALE